MAHMAVWALYGSESLGRPDFTFWRHIWVSRGLQGVVGLLRSGGLAGQVEIWRHLSKFGGSGRDLASFGGDLRSGGLAPYSEESGS